MKQQLQRFAQKIDALSLRERGIAFAMAVVVLLFLVNSLWIDPQFAAQKKLSRQIQENQNKIIEIQGVIQQKVIAHSTDPDIENLARLEQLRQKKQQSQDGLVDMQKGLISPDRMAVLLEDILKRHGRLRLTGLKTLPVASLTEPDATNAKSAEQPAAGLLYKHGVEITLQGSYLDMLQYMSELESMPWQLFWGRARLQVDEHPKATLTLTLYTLSLDKKWLNL